jgi:hypothetical protein
MTGRSPLRRRRSTLDCRAIEEEEEEEEEYVTSAAAVASYFSCQHLKGLPKEPLALCS